MSASSKNSSARNKHSTSNGSYDAPSIDITKEEFARISDALKKEEFRKLFFDYIDEIQDPENRKIYESEICQLEAERGVNVKFINPEPGFVVKTSLNGTLKCFVNIAKCAEIAKPSSEVYINTETGKRGLNWAIPLAQAGPRDDIDAHGKRCRVFDVVFHPDALHLAQRNAAFRQCLIDTALDGVEREYKVNLDRTNLKFPKLQFKGIARPTVIRTLAKNAPAETAEPHPLEDIYPKKPQSAEPNVLPLKTKANAQPEFTTPKHELKYRRDIDLAEYTNELDAKLQVTVPHELIVEIELPLLKSTAECQLDVTAKSLYLLSDRPGAKYRLKLELPYVVEDKSGSARFDTDTRRLCIRLPVLQQTATGQRDMHDTLIHLNREDSGVESDMRDEMHSNSESPVEDDEGNGEEVDDDENEETSCDGKANVATNAVLTPATFLKNSIHYQFPAKFDCNVLDNVMSLVLHVRNVQSESIVMLQQPKMLHLQFTSIGSGYYPTHYAFYLQLPNDTSIEITTAEAEAWENNVVLNLSLSSTSENLQRYLAGLDSNDLKEYTVQEKFQVAHHSRQRKKSLTNSTAPTAPFVPSLNISVERSECERSIEIEIKPREQQSTGAANTTEDEEHAEMQPQTQRKLNKKQKRKNKKRRSLSESACDDLRAAYQQQTQEHQQKQKQQQQQKKAAQSAANDNNKRNTDHHEDDDADSSSPERAELLTSKQSTTSSSVAVPAPASAQQRKQRSYSECRDSLASSGATPSFKGILKHYSRYEPRPSISDSCSSIDDFLSLSCSVDAAAATAYSLRFSQSFSDIPEEQQNVGDELSESCKKTVRFNEVIKKQIFRLDSSILGQRKKNQKRRDRKQRALRRLSEGDSADYEDNKPIAMEATSAQYLKSKGKHNSNNQNNKNANNGNKKRAEHDSGLDLSTDKSIANNNNKQHGNARARLESESSSDVEGCKNALMFEMDM